MLYYFLFAHRMLNNNMGYFIPFELVQQCMKPLGGLKMYVCISFHHKSECLYLQTPRTVAIKRIVLIVYWYKMDHFMGRNEILTVFVITTLHL